MVFDLLVSTFIGAIIGYLLCRRSKSRDKQPDSSVQNLTTTNSIDDMDRVDEQEVIKEIIEREKRDLCSVKDELDIGVDISKPLLLDAPRDNKRDDLVVLDGISIKIEEILNSIGIYHFDQIANWTKENINWIDQNSTISKESIVDQKWVDQANTLNITNKKIDNR
jgi:NADH-quinone oxidoreductase subunit E